MKTELRLNADVVCSDGPAGQLTDVILDPTTEEVTYLVVALENFGEVQHLVPVALVQESTGREVRLRCSRDELAQTEHFTQTELLPIDESTPWMTQDSLAFPVAAPQFAPRMIEHQRVPPGELALRSDTKIEASDGPVGHLVAFVLRSDDNHLADVVLQQGHLWRRREVVIPAAAIGCIDAAAVHLSLPKGRIHSWPTAPRGSAA